MRRINKEELLDMRYPLSPDYGVRLLKNARLVGCLGFMAYQHFLVI